MRPLTASVVGALVAWVVFAGDVTGRQLASLAVAAAGVPDLHHRHEHAH